jgi:hypothetical protein
MNFKKTEDEDGKNILHFFDGMVLLRTFSDGVQKL